MSARRTAAKLIRFHPAEIALIAAYARVCRQTPARFIRETALGAIPKSQRRGHAEPLLHELAGVANQLREIGQYVRGTSQDELASRLDAALELHLTVMRQLLEQRPSRRGRAE